MLSSGAPSRIVPFPSPVSRPYDLLCFVLYGAQNQTLPETPPLAAPRITVVGSYATGLTMKIQGLPAPKLTFVMFFSGWLFWAFAQHRSASASAVFAARIASSTPSSRDSIWNGKPAPSTYLHKQLDVTRCRWSFVFSFRAAYICIWKLLCSTRIGETHQWAQAHFLVSDTNIRRSE